MERLRFATIISVLIALLLPECTCETRGREGFGAGQQDWGYVSVRPHRHMFWWLYYATPPMVPIGFDSMAKPLIIWLQGGPGGSGTGYGNFEELGPLTTDLQSRNYSWVYDYNILFIDNPVGTGFSYVDGANADYFARDNAEIASDLVQCMKGIFEKLPELQNIPAYIIGESYGGKMAVDFAVAWSEAYKNKSIGGNLKGIALGDSSISPIDAITAWGPYLYNTGSIDREAKENIVRLADAAVEAMSSQNYWKAYNLKNQILDLIDNYTFNIDFFNILSKYDPLEHDTEKNEDLEKLMNGPVKKTLGLSADWTLINRDVSAALNGDRMRSVVSRVELLLNQTDLKIFVYSGQLDLIISTPGTIAWIEKLNWEFIPNWKNAVREPVIVNDVVEAFKKTYDKFSMYWIKRSGHMVPRDNPAATVQMLSDLTGTNSVYRYYYRT